MLKHSAGFSLTELLTVISIITILATISISSYSNLQKKARDGKRQSDLKLIQSALQQFYADNSYFPTTTDGTSKLTSPAKYLNSVPKEPNGETNYSYKALPDLCDNIADKRCTNYCLGTTLENTANAPAIQCSPASGNYGVAPP